MARVEAVKSVSAEAGADLSASQFRFMVTASDGQIDPVGTAGADADGVLLNKPDAAGRAAELAVSGIVKVVCGAAVTRGGKVSSDNQGRAIPAVSTHHVLGRALTTTATAGEMVEVLMDSSHHLLA